MSNRSTAFAVRKHQFRILPLLTILSCAPFALTDEQATSDQPTVTPCGLRVIAPQAGKESVFLLGGKTGTALALHVEYPSGTLVSFEQSECEVEKFTDDLGTEFDTGTVIGSSGFSGIYNIVEEGKHAYIDLRGEGIPAPQAQKLRAQGTLVFLEADELVKDQIDAVPLKKGSTFKIGEVEFRIALVDKPKWGDAEVAIEFKAPTRLDFIKSLTFRDADGKEIKSSRTTRTTAVINGQREDGQSYHLKRKVETLTLEVEYWKNLHEVKIPFSVETGIGLQTQ